MQNDRQLPCYGDLGLLEADPFPQPVTPGFELAPVGHTGEQQLNREGRVNMAPKGMEALHLESRWIRFGNPLYEFMTSLGISCARLTPCAAYHLCDLTFVILQRQKDRPIEVSLAYSVLEFPVVGNGVTFQRVFQRSDSGAE